MVRSPRQLYPWPLSFIKFKFPLKIHETCHLGWNKSFDMFRIKAWFYILYLWLRCFSFGTVHLSCTATDSDSTDCCCSLYTTTKTHTDTVNVITNNIDCFCLVGCWNYCYAFEFQLNCLLNLWFKLRECCIMYNNYRLQITFRQSK